MELSPIVPQDQESFLDMLTSDRVNPTYMLPDFGNREDAIPLFHRLEQLSREESRFVRCIRVQGQAVGFLNDVEIRDGSIELGYVIHPEHWGKGYATAALKQATQELFALGYREILCGAFAQNAASLRVMEKAGMTRLEASDGIGYRGKIHRCVYYSLSR